jgi:hypothetical protein
MAAGSMTITEYVSGTVKKIKATWTASTGDTGTVSGTTSNKYDGRIIGVCTVPGTAGDAPDDEYGLTVADVDSVDLLLGNGAGREQAVTEYISESSCAGVAKSALTIGITAAGSGNKGTVYIYVR